jgi:hypothetical protein
MLRFIIRLLGFALLGVAMTVGVIDGARAIADGGTELMRLEASIQWLFPRQFPALGPAISGNIHPLLWDPLLTTLLRIPAVIAMFALGTLLLILARPKTARITAPE